MAGEGDGALANCETLGPLDAVGVRQGNISVGPGIPYITGSQAASMTQDTSCRCSVDGSTRCESGSRDATKAHPLSFGKCLLAVRRIAAGRRVAIAGRHGWVSAREPLDDIDRQALPSELIRDRQQPSRPAIGGAVG